MDIYFIRHNLYIPSFRSDPVLAKEVEKSNLQFFLILQNTSCLLALSQAGVQYLKDYKLTPSFFDIILNYEEYSPSLLKRGQSGCASLTGDSGGEFKILLIKNIK